MLTLDDGRLMEDAVVTEDPELRAEERIIALQEDEEK